MLKFLSLREEHPYFVYEGFQVHENKDFLHIEFHFNLSGKYHFYPELKLPISQVNDKDILSDKGIMNIIFQVGMVELISYWKAACPPKVIIKPYQLDKFQVKWWKKLYFNGLGEFFYLNNINTSINDFMQIECKATKKTVKSSIHPNNNTTLIPVGGGKDSIVTLEVMKDSAMESACMIVNPRPASLNSAIIAGFNNEDIIQIKRTIHPQLLELNKNGFLNGHTPFSALLAFISLLTAMLTKRKYILLSNESSANEATVNNSNINHQYSKSFEFEQDFRDYVKKYISKEYEYLSLLRPLSEIQIGKIFSNYNSHFSTFRSCNAGSKTNKWCGECPKCLFTFIILSPFIHPVVLENIFGTNLFENEKLLQTLKELIGVLEVKPFECVGTKEEISTALNLAIKKYYNMESLPPLLHYFVQTSFYQKNIHDISKEIEREHNLDEHLLQLIKRHL